MATFFKVEVFIVKLFKGVITREILLFESVNGLRPPVFALQGLGGFVTLGHLVGFNPPV